MPEPVLSTTDILLAWDPAPLVLDRVAGIIRQGYPDITDFPVSPSWPDPEAPAPAGHWLLPAGCPLFRGDEPAELPHVACIIQQDEPSKPRDHSRRFWTVQFSVTVSVDRSLEADRLRDSAQFLAFALAEDFTGHPARHRLSTPQLRVRAVNSVHTALPDLSGDWNPVYAVDVELFCSAIDALPPTDLFPGI